MSRYTVYVTPGAWKEIKSLPGNMRQRVRRAVDALAADRDRIVARSLTCLTFGLSYIVCDWIDGVSSTQSRRGSVWSTFWPYASARRMTMVIWRI